MSEINHQYTYIHEPIDVAGFSTNGVFKLKSFRWRNHIHTVKEHCLIARAKKGIAPIWLYSIATDDGSYKIRLDTDTLTWWLEEIYSHVST